MAPHAESPKQNGWSRGAMAVHEGNRSMQNGGFTTHKSFLKQASPDDLHDVVCVGFGPASLAIAVALHDAMEKGSNTFLKTDNPKVAFLERQPQFAWHAGMQIPGAKMQISFVKDLATLRNPRSQFTFLNYLHQNGRLVQFTNLGTFLPQRIEYEDYMRWCAGWFEDLVSYNEEVVHIQSNSKAGVVTTFTVTSRNESTGEVSSRRAKHVVIAVGGRPKIPDSFPQKHPRIIHSSQFITASPHIFSDPAKPMKIGVIGSGQSAAEIFHNLPSQFPRSKSYLLIKGSALRPSDDSPFVNEIFDPSRVDDYYSQSPSIRSAAIAQDKSTNYGVVRLELLEEIYNTFYTQRIKHGADNEAAWPQQMLVHRTVTAISDLADGTGRVRMHIRNDSNKFMKAPSDGEDTLDVDLVVVAAGYQRDIHEAMLKNVRALMPGGDDEGKKWDVGRDYRVKFEEGTVARDAGVWLQGCNEATHGLSDTLLSILATRGGEMVDSIFGKTGLEHQQHDAANGNSYGTADSGH